MAANRITLHGGLLPNALSRFVAVGIKLICHPAWSQADLKFGRYTHEFENVPNKEYVIGLEQHRHAVALTINDMIVYERAIDLTKNQQLNLAKFPCGYTLNVLLSEDLKYANAPFATWYAYNVKPLRLMAPTLPVRN